MKLKKLVMIYRKHLHQLQDFYDKSFICGNCSFEQIIIEAYR